MSNVLSVKNLRTEFRMRTANVVAVDGVSFDIAEGESMGLVGESGCGKTTIGMSIMRLLPDNGHVVGGSVNLLGRDLATLSEKEMQKVRGNEVALIPQDPMTSLNPTMTIGRQIAEGYRIHRGATKQEAEARALEVLRLVEMPRPEERLGQYPHELSGGLRQRVMIAMALVCEPKLLIADEPTTALDVTIQAQILDLIDRLRRELKMAVLLITHDMGVIAGRTDRVAVMYAGEKVEEASTEELFTKMRHPYSQSLLNAVPKVDQGQRRLLSIPGLPPDLSKEIVGCRFAPRCQFATDKCKTTAPETSTSKDGAHAWSCFFPVDGISTDEGTGLIHKSTDLASRPVVLDVVNLVKEYPLRSNGIIHRTVGSVKAVSNVSFQIREGETFGLVGESGCGKTTIGKLLTRLETATGGEIRYNGQDFNELKGSDLRTARRNLQMMFQDPYSSLDPRQRVSSILEEPLIVQEVGTKEERQARVDELLNQVGLSKAAKLRYSHEFSGGQRQRIGLARALALRPAVIVADEPVSALDVSIQAQILNLIKDLQQEMNLTLVMISHDLGVVRYMADTIGVMYLGKIVEIGPAQQVYENPVHPYTRGLLDSVPVAEVGGGLGGERSAIVGELPSATNPPSGCRFRTRCPFADEQCANEEPAMALYGDGHQSACHHPLRTPVTLSSASR